MSGLFQPLEKAAIVLSTSTRHVEDDRGKFLILKVRNAIGEELITNLDNPLLITNLYSCHFPAGLPPK